MRATKCPLDWKYAYISSADGRNQENVRSLGQRFGLVSESEVGENTFCGERDRKDEKKEKVNVQNKC